MRNIYSTLVLALVICGFNSFGQSFSGLTVNATNTTATVTFSGGAAGNNGGTQDLATGDFAVSVSASTNGGSVAAGTVTLSLVTHTAGTATATLSFTISGTAD